VCCTIAPECHVLQCNEWWVWLLYPGAKRTRRDITERLDIYVAADQSIGLLSSLSYSSENSVGEWKTDLTAIKTAIVKDRSSDEPNNGLKDSLLRNISTLSEKMSAGLRERYPSCGLPELRGNELLTIGHITRNWTTWTPEQGHHALA
jgi:hypothetical protein